MGDTISNSIAGLALVLSAGGLFLAWRSYRASEVSASAARDSAQAAGQAVDLARAEHHQARTPRFRLQVWQVDSQYGIARLPLKLILLGPEDLSRVMVEVGGYQLPDIEEAFEIYVKSFTPSAARTYPANLGRMRVGDIIEFEIYPRSGSQSVEWLRVACSGLEKEHWTVAVEPTQV